MIRKVAILMAAALLSASPLLAQQSSRQSTANRRGGMFVQGAEIDLPLVAQFDTNDKDGRLDYTERKAARAYVASHPELRPPSRGRRSSQTGSPGPKLTPADVKTYRDEPLYDPGVLRTLFLEFEHDDWEQELAAFWHTDVEVPAGLVVDGRKYRDVGVSFRGNNSFHAVSAGLKRALSLTIDFAHNQDLLGYRKLHLLNANEDPTFMRTALYLQVSRDYLPALKANFMRVVINGESWGIYATQQAFDSDFEQETFGTKKGVRWKSPNNSTGGGLAYLGEDVDLYRRWYEQKGKKDKPKAWNALIRLCKVLDETPPEQLEQALEPVLDVDVALRFMALDIALVNNDGYWNDGCDFNLYQDKNGRFIVTPHDVNEGLRIRGRGDVSRPNPLIALDDPNKALRHKLLAIPSLRKRYLAYIGDIAEKWLDWQHLGPVIENYRELLEKDVAADTRKLTATEAFRPGIYGEEGEEPPGAGTLKGFAEQRRAYLLSHPEIVKARGR